VNEPADPILPDLASRWLGARSRRCSSRAALRASPGAPSPFEGAPLVRACDYSRLSGRHTPPGFALRRAPAAEPALRGFWAQKPGFSGRDFLGTTLWRAYDAWRDRHKVVRGAQG
jgi:hypothetical protein